MFVTSRNRMGIQTFIIFLWLFISFFLFQLPVYSQEPLKILLFDFEKIGGDQKYERLEQELPKQLKSLLNQSVETNIHVERFAEVRKEKEYFSTLPLQKRMIGFLTDEDLKPIIDSVSVDYNYILDGRFWEKLDIITAEVRLLDCQTGGIICSYDEREPDKEERKTIQERLAEKFTKDIEMYLVASIRIGLIDFKKTGGSPKFDFLEESIPTMLATGLSASRQFRLIETKSESILKYMREEGRRGIFDERTILEVGRKINANYLIMGEFWEYEDKIRIDARCVSIETGEIILSEGITLDRIEIENISNEIKALASSIRIMIEKDFMKKEKQIKSIAVISFPPLPNTKKNRLISGNIRRTMARKLRMIFELRVIEDPKKISKYLDAKEDKLKICSELGVNTLLTIQYEDLYEDLVIVDADLYDIAKPTRELYADSRRMKLKKLDEFINKVISRTLESLRIDKPEESGLKEMKAIQVPTFTTRWSVGGLISSINRASNKPYRDGGESIYFELFINYKFTNRLKGEFQAGFDTGNTTKETFNNTDIFFQVNNTQNSFVIKYDLIKVSSFDMYAGLGATFFKVFRKYETLSDGKKEYAGAIGGGLMTLGGIELNVEKLGISLYFETRYILGTKVAKRDIQIGQNGDYFPGGKLGGFYMASAIAYNFNF